MRLTNIGVGVASTRNVRRRPESLSLTLVCLLNFGGSLKMKKSLLSERTILQAII